MSAARWMRRRARSAHEAAIEILDQARSFMEPRFAREFACLVSRAMREYIEARFGVHALHRTTPEIIERLRRMPEPAVLERCDKIRDLLEHCDRARIGAGDLSGGQIEAIHLWAWGFVGITRERRRARAS